MCGFILFLRDFSQIILYEIWDSSYFTVLLEHTAKSMDKSRTMKKRQTNRWVVLGWHFFYKLGCVLSTRDEIIKYIQKGSNYTLILLYTCPDILQQHSLTYHKHFLQSLFLKQTFIHEIHKALGNLGSLQQPESKVRWFNIWIFPANLFDGKQNYSGSVYLLFQHLEFICHWSRILQRWTQGQCCLDLSDIPNVG